MSIDHFLQLAGVVIWRDGKRDNILQCSCGENSCDHSKPDREIETVKTVLNPRSSNSSIERLIE